MMSVLVQMACQGTEAAPHMGDTDQNLSHMLKSTCS